MMTKASGKRHLRVTCPRGFSRGPSPFFVDNILTVGQKDIPLVNLPPRNFLKYPAFALALRHASSTAPGLWPPCLGRGDHGRRKRRASGFKFVQKGSKKHIGDLVFHAWATFGFDLFLSTGACLLKLGFFFHLVRWYDSELVISGIFFFIFRDSTFVDTLLTQLDFDSDPMTHWHVFCVRNCSRLRLKWPNSCFQDWRVFAIWFFN